MPRYFENQQPNATETVAGPTSYTFKVSDAKEIDFARIILENKSAEAILVSTLTQPDMISILYLSCSFLDSLNNSEVLVAGEKLSLGWGYRAFVNPETTQLFGWRSKFVDNTKVLCKELKAARAYKNAITVIVEIL